MGVFSLHRGCSNRRLAVGAFLFCLFICCPLTGAQAATKFSTIKVHPNADLGSYFFVQESRTLPQLNWHLGTAFLYYNRPLDINLQRVIVRRTGTRTVSAGMDGINHMFYQYFYGALGLTDWMSLSADFPLFWAYEYAATTGAARSSKFYYVKPGDINAALKFRLLDPDKYPVGISLMPSVTVPTGKDSHYLGDEGVTGEARVIIEVKPVDKLNIAFNAAYQTREKVNTGYVSFRDVIRMSLGANYRVAKNVSVIAEAETQTPVTDFYGQRSTSPAEARLGARWNPNGSQWLLGLGGSVGIIHGSGMPRYAGFVSVGYTGKRPKPKIKVTKLAQLDGVDQCRRVAADDGNGRYLFVCAVYFGFDKSTTGDVDVIRSVAGAIKNSGENVTVEVRGWADKAGQAKYNKQLSLKRARFVAKTIEKELGDNAHKAEIKVLGIGEDTLRPAKEARRADMLLK